MKLFKTLTLLAIVLCFGCSEPTTIEKVENATSQIDIDRNLIIDYVKTSSLDGKFTPSGIYYVITEEGDGPSGKDLTPTSRVSTHYHGTFLDGKVFDSSVDRGKPFDFALNQVIPGWVEAVKLLNVGGKGTFVIPSHLAYGAGGYPGLIPANSVLRFEVELLKI